MWSFYDDIIETARRIKKHMPDGRFPSVTWLARTKYYKGRPVELWEPSSWSRFIRQLSSIGGVAKIHESLGTASPNWATRRTKYTKENVIDQLKTFYAEHNDLPGNIQSSLTRLPSRTPEEQKLCKIAGHLATLVRKFIGCNSVVRDVLHIHKASRPQISVAFVTAQLKAFYEQHHDMPGNVQSRLNRIKRSPDQQQLWLSSGKLAQQVRKALGTNRDAKIAISVV